MVVTALLILTLSIVCFFVRKQRSIHKHNNNQFPLRDHERTSNPQVVITDQNIEKQQSNEGYHYQNIQNIFNDEFEQEATYINDPNKGTYHGDRNISEPSSSSVSYLNLQNNPNQLYMTIDETSMIPVESENDQTQQKYINIQEEPAYINTKINSKTAMNPTEYSENNAPMSSPKEETILFSKSIHINEFSATYQQYVASGIEKHSLFFIEFAKLNEESSMNAPLETDEALKAKNKPNKLSKSTNLNFVNNFDSDTPNFEFNYIKASYISENQFIARMHPTKETLPDFLQLIYQCEASLIIMLTTRREKARIISGVSNRVCYWPKKDEPISCEPYITTLISSAETAAFVKQEISIKNNADGKEHIFTQFISPIWNEDSTVAEMSSAVNLLIRIIKQSQDDPTKTIIIHCQDGISKSGILLSAISSVKELALTKTISIFNTVKDLRESSIEIVPTLVSLLFKFCSDCLFLIPTYLLLSQWSFIKVISFFRLATQPVIL